MKGLLVRDLGRIGWSQALTIQRRLADELARGAPGASNTILLCEHNPVYTTGRKVALPDAACARLRALGAEVEKAGRGGDITFHGPGQLVGYPIIRLADFQSGPAVRWYVNGLEQAIIRACKVWGIDAETSPHTGVWVGDEKIAAIGVQVSRGVTFHGFALNCNTDMTWFSHIVPCGIADKGVTSLSRQLHRDVPISEAKEPLTQAIAQFLGASSASWASDEEISRLKADAAVAAAPAPDDAAA